MNFNVYGSIEIYQGYVDWVTTECNALELQQIVWEICVARVCSIFHYCVAIQNQLVGTICFGRHSEYFELIDNFEYNQRNSVGFRRVLQNLRVQHHNEKCFEKE